MTRPHRFASESSARRRSLVLLAACLLVPASQAASRPTLVRDSLGGPDDVLAGAAVAVLPGGDLLVADGERGRVVRFGSDGSPRGGFGRRGTGSGEFATGPTDIALSPTGAIAYVADGTRVHAFDVATGLEIATSAPNAVRYVAASLDGSSVFGSSGGSTCAIHRLDASLTEVALWSVPPCGPATFELPQPMELVADPAGLLAIGPFLEHARRVDTTTGTVTGSMTIPGFGGLPSFFVKTLGAARDPIRGGLVLRTPDRYGFGLVRLSTAGVDLGGLSWPGFRGEPGRSDGPEGRFTADVRDIAVAPDGSVVAVEGPGRLVRVDDRPYLSRTTQGTVVTSAPVTFEALGSFASFSVPARYDWDLDGDGAFEQLDAGPQRTASFRTEGTVAVRVRATAIDGSVGVAELPVQVSANRPTAALAAPRVTVGGDAVVLDASASRVAHGSIAAFRWDVDGDGRFERETATASLTARLVPSGTRTVRVAVRSQDGFEAIATAPIDVRPKPPTGVPGISINAGASTTRRRSVTLRLVWPRFARSMTISNDGGFAGARPRRLSNRVVWSLRAGNGPRTVYVRFRGSSGDAAAFDPVPTLTYSDDINLVTRRPRR